MTFFIQNVGATDIVVIVNEKNPISFISTDQLNSFFTKKERSWKNGQAVRFFDHRDENMNRNIFLAKFIKKTSREIELYWIGEKIYTGNIAPIRVTSDSMMVSMVSRFNGGIGYVSNTFKLPKTVKKILVKP
jgi:ABC-type phosphate transport system substrate-binding protein